MQASDFDSPLEAYFAYTAKPLSQQPSRNFGSLNSLPKELISMIFNKVSSLADLKATRLVSKNCSQMVDPQYRHCKKIRETAFQNFEMIRPNIFNMHCMRNYMHDYHTTNFILDQEGNLVALCGSDQMMLVKDEEGRFNPSRDFIPSEEHSTLSIEWAKMYRFEEPVKIIKMPEAGTAKEVAEVMASLAQPFYEGSSALAYRDRTPDQNYIDWRRPVHRVNTYKINDIFQAGMERLTEKDK